MNLIGSQFSTAFIDVVLALDGIALCMVLVIAVTYAINGHGAKLREHAAEMLALLAAHLRLRHWH